MRAIKYNGNLITFAGKILRMAEYVYQEGIHWLRVKLGLGTVENRVFTEEFFKFQEEQQMPSTRIAAFKVSGFNKRETGIFDYSQRLFNLMNEDKLGPEKITTWSTVAGMSFSGGKLIFTGTSGVAIALNTASTLHKVMRVEFTLDSYTSGILYFGNGQMFGPVLQVGADGTRVGSVFVYYKRVTASNENFGFFSSSFIGTISNISLKEINIKETPLGNQLIQNGNFVSGSTGWNLGSGWSINDGKAFCDGSQTSTSYLFTGVASEGGLVNKIIFSVTNISSGTIRIRLGNSVTTEYLTPWITTDGTYTYYKPLMPSPNNSPIFIEASVDFIGYVSLLSVEEVLINHNPDLVQITSANQPYLVRKGIKNPSGGSDYMTHSTIRFSANEAWSASWIGVINRATHNQLFGSSGLSNNSMFTTSWNTSFSPYWRNSTGTSVATLSGGSSFIRSTFGKTVHLVLAADGTNNLKLYGNGQILYTNNFAAGTAMNFSRLGFANGTSETEAHNGIHNGYILREGVLTEAQVLAEYNFLKQYFPDIETKLVGSKSIATDNCEMVATPMGNVINQNDLAASEGVERITNGTFEGSFTGGLAQGWLNYGAIPTQETGRTVGYAQGIARGTGDQVYQIPSIVASVGKWMKISFWYKVVSGTGAYLQYYKNTQLTQTEWTYVSYYFQYNGVGAGADFHSGGVGSKIIIDDVSIKEVGWYDADSLYATLISQGSTVANALQSAAMWRSPDNNLDKQAVFGKLYNGYAVELLKMDINAYNAANPTAPWGYHVATRADLNAIANELGGTDVAGMKMKETGTDYWLSDNGDNTSGVSLLGSGLIDENGNYVAYNEATGIWTSDDFDQNNTYVATVHNDLNKLIIE